jgi:hypothetical protein
MPTANLPPDQSAFVRELKGYLAGRTICHTAANYDADGQVTELTFDIGDGADLIIKADEDYPLNLTVRFGHRPTGLGQSAVAQVVDAWTIAGPAPSFHTRMQSKLRHEWPVLAAAIERLATQHGRR